MEFFCSSQRFQWVTLKQNVRRSGSKARRSHRAVSRCFQESGSIYLQFTCSTSLQLEVIFEVLEEYDWTSFSVVTTRHHGYEDFLAMVEGMTDGSFIGWEKKSVVILNVTDDPGGARAKRMLKDNEAQVGPGPSLVASFVSPGNNVKTFPLNALLNTM